MLLPNVFSSLFSGICPSNTQLPIQCKLKHSTTLYPKVKWDVTENRRVALFRAAVTNLIGSWPFPNSKAYLLTKVNNHTYFVAIWSKTYDHEMSEQNSMSAKRLDFQLKSHWFNENDIIHIRCFFVDLEVSWYTSRVHRRVAIWLLQVLWKCWLVLPSSLEWLLLPHLFHAKKWS